MANPTPLGERRREPLASDGIERPPEIGDGDGTGGPIHRGDRPSSARSAEPRIDAPHVADGGKDRLESPALPIEPIDAELVEATRDQTISVTAGHVELEQLELEQADAEQPADAVVVEETQTDPSKEPAGAGQGGRSLVRRVLGFIGWLTRGTFCIVSLVVLLATLTAVPIFQLIAFGYLLSVSGGLAAGGRFRDALPQLQQAGQIGLAAVAIFLAALPTQLLAHWESVAYLINPDSNQATAMRAVAIGCSALATFYLLWAWVRGGRLRHYLWPQPKRFFREGLRWNTWKTAPDRLWDFTASLQLPKYFWLGVRGAAGTLIWLLPAMVIIAAFRNGETGLAGLVGFASLLCLGISLLYLPMLQAHYAAENRFSALFEVRTIRRLFRRAPWAWLLAMVIALVLTPIPLYLLKIEATPREVMWLPCLVFIAFILPARIATGLALRRAHHREESRRVWGKISRILVRLLMPVVVGIYLLFVYVSQYTSWDGLLTWVQQHAILIPVPFLSGI